MDRRVVIEHTSDSDIRFWYTPANRINNGQAGRWDDKDFILNTMGFHHFHLDERIKPDGISERTDDVLFARVSRDDFHAFAIFNHSVFDNDVGESGKMNDERKRLWGIFDEYLHIPNDREHGSV